MKGNNREITYCGTLCSSFCLLSNSLKKLIIPSKTVFLLPYKGGHYIKALQGLQYPRELHSTPTPITNVMVFFISLHKSLRCGRAPVWFISRWSDAGLVYMFPLTALIEELEEAEAPIYSFLKVIIN